MGNKQGKEESETEGNPNLQSPSPKAVYNKRFAATFLGFNESLEKSVTGGTGGGVGDESTAQLQSGTCAEDCFSRKVFGGEHQGFGRLLFRAAMCANQAGKTMLVIHFCNLGVNLVELTDHTNQIQWYFDVFTEGKGYITQPEMQEMLWTVCLVTYCQAGMNMSSEIKQDDTVFKAMSSSLFGREDRADWATFKTWCYLSCRYFYKALHTYTLNALLGHLPTEFKGGASAEESQVVSNIRSRTSVISWTMLWAMCCCIPPSYFQAAGTPTDMGSQLASPAVPLEAVTSPGSWQQLYSSSKDGLSVTRFQKSVFDYKGHSILLLSFQDTLYCLALDEEWRETTQKFGGVESSFFQILPQFKFIQGGAPMVYINLNNRTMPQNMSIGKTPQTTFVKVDAELSKVNHYGIDFNLSAIEVWGCASQAVRTAQLQQHQWNEKEAEKYKNRKLKIGVEDWKDSPDRQILEMGGVKTEHAER